MQPRRPRIPPLPLRPDIAGSFESRIQLAHQHFSRGEFVRAGFLFEELATAAARRGGPRAPLFFLQASRAFFHAREAEKAMQLARSAYNAWQARPAGSPAAGLLRLADEADRLGYVQQAQALRSWLADFPDRADSPASNPAAGGAKPRLPLQCPACGGPVYPDEVEWLDDKTARCDFCGNPLRADGDR